MRASAHLVADYSARDIEVRAVVVGELPVLVAFFENVVVVLEEGNGVLVVDRQDRLLMAHAVDVGERIKVADDDVRVEVTHVAHVGLNIFKRVRGRFGKDLERSLVTIESVFFVDEWESGDFDHVGKVFLEERECASAHDDFHFVPLREKVGQGDARANRVPHPFARDAVEDFHGASCNRRPAWPRSTPSKARDLQDHATASEAPAS